MTAHAVSQGVQRGVEGPRVLIVLLVFVFVFIVVVLPYIIIITILLHRTSLQSLQKPRQLRRSNGLVLGLVLRIPEYVRHIAE
jgi:hypothetical protein